LRSKWKMANLTSAQHTLNTFGRPTLANFLLIAPTQIM
jgi:hypothetical protein